MKYFLYLFFLFQSIFLILFVIRLHFFNKDGLTDLQRIINKDDNNNNIIFKNKLFGNKIGQKLFFGNTSIIYIVTFFYCSFWVSISSFLVINDPYYYKIGGYSVYSFVIGFFLFIFYFVSIDIFCTISIVIRGLITLNPLRIINDLIFY